jgi:hypothetical protein
MLAVPNARSLHFYPACGRFTKITQKDRNMSSRRFSLGRIILAFMGLTILVFGMALTAAQWNFSRNAGPAVGKVVALQWEGKDRTEQRPVIAFTDLQGETHALPTNIASSAWSYAVGDTVVVLYNPSNGGEIRLGGWGNTWAPGLIAAGVGLLMLRFSRRKATATAVAVPANAANTANPWQMDAAEEQSKAQMIEVISNRHQAKPVAKPVPEQRSAPARTPKTTEPTVRRMR